MQKEEINLTVCIATYDRWDSFRNTLGSIQIQTLRGIEIIVVDDCSREVVPRDLKDSMDREGVVFVRHDKNQGLATARNTAISLAKGRYFSFCDDDDRWPPEMAKGLVEALESAPGGAGMAIGQQEWKRNAFMERVGAYPRLTKIMRWGITPPVGSQIYLTSLVREAGGYNPAVKSGVDHDLWISLAAKDPKVAFAWGKCATVSDDIHADRMTSVEENRRKKIKDALEIWRPQIIRIFGEDFYNHFCWSYETSMNYTFFTISVKRGHYLQAMKKLFGKGVMAYCAESLKGIVTRRKRVKAFASYGSDS